MTAQPSSPNIHFYFDPSCPWAYVTSLWAKNVADQRGFTIRWRAFSLRMKNAPPEGADRLPPSMGHRCLRVVAAAQATGADDNAIGALYGEMGRRRHASGLADRPDIGAPEELASMLDACGLDAALASAADEDRWDQAIEADMSEAIEKAGNDIGVPIIVLDDGDGPAWFGPVVSRAPDGEEALRLWDAFETVARIPYLFELKRGRTERPVTTQ